MNEYEIAGPSLVQCHHLRQVAQQKEIFTTSDGNRMLQPTLCGRILFFGLELPATLSLHFIYMRPRRFHVEYQLMETRVMQGR